MGAQDFRGVWEGPGGGWVAARSFPCPVSFHSRVGGGFGWAGASGAEARPAQDGSSTGATGALFLRRDSPLSFSS